MPIIIEKISDPMKKLLGVQADESNKDWELGKIETPFWTAPKKEVTIYDRLVPQPKVPGIRTRDRDYDTKLPEDVTDITKLVKDGDYRLYEYDEFPAFADPETGKYYISGEIIDKRYPFGPVFYPKFVDDSDLNLSGFKKLPNLKGVLPKRDYIGGSKREVGLKVLNKLPGIKDYILKLSDTYNINPNVFIQRLINEGYLQGIAKDYNYGTVKNQKAFNWQSYVDNEIVGRDQLGMDTFGDHYNAGHLNLRREIPFQPIIRPNEDETGNEYTSGIYNNLYDALEANAAMFEYFTKLGKQRGLQGSDLDYWVNAAYNMGENHKDLNNIDYIRKRYSFKPFL